MGPQTNAVTHSILIFEKNGTDEKSLIFMPKVDIRSEPARPGPTRPGPTVTLFDGLFLRKYER